MHLKLISCNVFMREAAICLARSPHIIDVEFTELGEHVHPDKLRALLQGHIDAADERVTPYDAILLLFGICGNATAGLQARRAPLVLPRAHDCCTILLGSRDAFKEHFADNPSMPFSSSGYMERGDYYMRTDDGESALHYGDAYAAYVEQYGEENARFIWDSLHPKHPELESKAVFIDLPETHHLGAAERFREKVEADGKTCTVLPGSLSLIDGLLSGAWDPECFLKVEPGQSIQAVYDWDEVVRAGEGENVQQPTRHVQ